MLCGPRSAALVGLALADFADGASGEAYPSHDVLVRVLAYSGRNGRKQLAKHIGTLEAEGWIEPVSQKTAPGVARVYRLRTPATVPKAVVDELVEPSAGMWERILKALGRPREATRGVEPPRCAEHGASTPRNTGRPRPEHGASTPGTRGVHAPPSSFKSIEDVLKCAPRSRGVARGARDPAPAQLGRMPDDDPRKVLCEPRAKVSK
jgi:hypothetical protein